MVEQEYYLGLDLGQKRSHTAIVVVERQMVREQRRNPVTYALEWENLQPPRVMVR